MCLFQNTFHLHLKFQLYKVVRLPELTAAVIFSISNKPSVKHLQHQGFIERRGGGGKTEDGVYAAGNCGIHNQTVLVQP